MPAVAYRLWSLGTSLKKNHLSLAPRRGEAREAAPAADGGEELDWRLPGWTWKRDFFVLVLNLPASWVRGGSVPLLSCAVQNGTVGAETVAVSGQWEPERTP